MATDVSAGQKKLFDALVSEAPLELNRLFLKGIPKWERGACVTYARIVVEVLREFHFRTAWVRPVYVETGNRVALDYLAGKISREEAIKRGGKIQIWGDIALGQAYQHAVCYLPVQDVVVDLAMEERLSGLVPSRPYWAEVGKFPWWIVKFEFRDYPLEYRAYETQPENVKRAKEFIRRVVRRAGFER